MGLAPVFANPSTAGELVLAAVLTDAVVVTLVAAVVDPAVVTVVDPAVVVAVDPAVVVASAAVSEAVLAKVCCAEHLEKYLYFVLEKIKQNKNLCIRSLRKTREVD